MSILPRDHRAAINRLLGRSARRRKRLDSHTSPS